MIGALKTVPSINPYLPFGMLCKSDINRIFIESLY